MVIRKIKSVLKKIERAIIASKNNATQAYYLRLLNNMYRDVKAEVLSMFFQTLCMKNVVLQELY